MKIKISKRGSAFEVDAVEMPGMPPVGKGGGMTEALAEFLILYQARLGIEIEAETSVDDAARQRLAATTATAARIWANY